jgi:hypothetical protein
MRRVLEYNLLVFDDFSSARNAYKVGSQNFPTPKMMLLLSWRRGSPLEAPPDFIFSKVTKIKTKTILKTRNDRVFVLSNHISLQVWSQTCSS